MCRSRHDVKEVYTLSQINKLISRMVTAPSDFREADLDRVMAYFRYVKQTASGSGIKYVCAEANSMVNFHRPHSGGKANIKVATIKDVVSELKRAGKIPCVT